MKNNTLLASPSTEDAEFLSRIQNGNLNVRDLLMAAPARLLNTSVEEVNFPTRFVSRLRSENVNTLADLLRVRLEPGKNLGARTIEVATEELTKFFVKKVNQGPLVTLRDMMEDFANDLLAREARIWEMRMGLKGERFTLDAVGQKFGLTRERVRQIESALFGQFSKKYPATNTLISQVRDGMTLGELITCSGTLVNANDTLPLASILELLEPKYYLISREGVEAVISTTPRSEIETTVRQTLNFAEKIFRTSEVLVTRSVLVSELQKIEDDTARNLALASVEKDGIWSGDTLLSPNRDKTNIAIGILQSSPRPVHIEDLISGIRVYIDEEPSAESLRSSLSLIPSVRSFGYGTFGFSRHIWLTEKQVADIIATCERIVQRGKSGYQWNTKDLLGKLQDKYTTLNISHHELNVILQESKKLAYLGRLTWVLRGEHDVERKTYRDIFVNVLEKAGKPLPESVLIERVQKQRGFHPNVHLRNESEVIEIGQDVWGLTRRDNPFSKAEVAKLTKAFDASFGGDFTNEYLDAKKIDRKGMKASEIMKIIEVLA